jgi:hypothetical protein
MQFCGAALDAIDVTVGRASGAAPDQKIGLLAFLFPRVRLTSHLHFTQGASAFIVRRPNRSRNTIRPVLNGILPAPPAAQSRPVPRGAF